MKSLILMASLFLTAPTYAVDLLGIALGKPVSYPTCKYDASKSAKNGIPINKPCYEGSQRGDTGAVMFIPGSLPHDIDPIVLVELISGNVEAIHATSRLFHEQNAPLLQALRDKFGPGEIKVTEERVSARWRIGTSLVSFDSFGDTRVTLISVKSEAGIGREEVEKAEKERQKIKL